MQLGHGDGRSVQAGALRPGVIGGAFAEIGGGRGGVAYIGRAGQGSKQCALLLVILQHGMKIVGRGKFLIGGDLLTRAGEQQPFARRGGQVGVPVADGIAAAALHADIRPHYRQGDAAKGSCGKGHARALGGSIRGEIAAAHSLKQLQPLFVGLVLGHGLVGRFHQRGQAGYVPVIARSGCLGGEGHAEDQCHQQHRAQQQRAQTPRAGIHNGKNSVFHASFTSIEAG